MLRQLLLKLENQETKGIFEYSIVIVDNDVSESARNTVEYYITQSKLSIGYYVEPNQNIALARNKVVEHAEGDFLAFIDDDELPNRDWLLVLYETLNNYKADGVLGPVQPFFETEPPEWVLKGSFFERPTHYTGHVLAWKNTRTGNVLIKRELFKKNLNWFNPVMGSGGEDRDFFRRKIEEGYVFIWCNEAPVFEIITPSRWKRSVLIKRALVRGKMALKNTRVRSASVLKSMFAVVLYSAWLPIAIFLGHHIFMRYLIKNFDHLGKVLAFCGIDCVKEKYVGG